MHGPVGVTNDQGRLDPGSLAGAHRKVGGAHLYEQRDERRFSGPEDDRAPPDDRRARRARRRFEPRALIVGKHAGEESARLETC